MLLTVNIVRVVKWFGSSPNDGEGGSNIRCPRSVGEFHWITVNGVPEQLSIDASNSSFDIKLANKSRLYDKLPYNMDFDFDGFFNARCHQYFRRISYSCIDSRAKCGTRTITWPSSLIIFNNDKLSPTNKINYLR